MPLVNFDGIPGPTHNYAGLARGNLAAERNARTVANPRAAALQGLAKARALAARGFAQAVLPPHERPDTRALRALGFSGTDADIVARAATDAPQLLAACSSAAAMWTANAATVSPSADTLDGRVHFTPANLVSHFHRSLEAPTTTRVLRAIFADPAHFVVHDPLPAAPQTGRRGRRESHPVRSRAGSSRRRALRLRPRGLRRRGRRAAAIRRAPDPRGVGRHRAPPRARPGAHGLRAAESRGDRCRRLPQRRDRRRPRHGAAVPRAGMGPPGCRARGASRVSRRRVPADRRARGRGESRRRRRQLSLQQPAAAARRRPVDPRRTRRVSRERPRGRLSRHAARAAADRSRSSSPST